jgi:hypothetical protein
VPDFRRHPETSDGRPKVAMGKQDATRLNGYSHNWCDPTTWYSDSVRVVDEVAENTGDNQIYQLDNYNVIDTYHGKLFEEDFLTDNDGYSYRVVVKVNDVDGYTEQDPHYGSGGNFTIDYANAQVNFLSPLLESDVVKVTYYYEDGSTFILPVESGMQLFIEAGEAQFSDDLEMLDTIKYQVFIINPYNPSGPKIPYGQPNVYKTITDLQIEATKAYPKYPSIGGTGWRGMQREVLILNWDYVSGTLLKSSYGSEIHIWLEHDTPYGGTYASMTFYGVIETETS